MLLFFDTETTGLVSSHLPLEHEDQPHIVQLAMIMTDDDGTERACVSLPINPDVHIPLASSRIHGITKELALQFGITPRTAVRCFYDLGLRADTWIGHNIGFDIEIMKIAMHRVESTINTSITDKIFECTMELSKPIVKLPPTAKMRKVGMFQPKPPRLGEAYKYFFNEELIGAHDALVDVRACMRIYFEIQRRKEADL